MKRVLIVTYYWPPSGGSGVQRWLKFAKYLPDFDWQPVVVAPLEADYAVRDESLTKDIPEQVEVLRFPIREPYSAYRKLTGASETQAVTVIGASKKPGILKRLSYWIRANFFVPDPKIMWVKPTVAALKEYLKRNPVDAVITTGPPHSIHLIGKALKEHNPTLTWILDVRDPWSKFDVHLSFGPSIWARKKNQRLEREALAAADKVLSTSYSMPTQLEEFDTRKFVTITNGFDEEDIEAIEPTTRSSEKFVVFHAGLLNAVRNPKAVWAGLDRLCRRSEKFRERLQIELIGTVAPEVRQSLEKYASLRDRYTITSWIDHDELLKRYAAASIFLLCPNQTENAKAQINGKLYEYLAIGKPILHVGPFDADNTTLLDLTHSGLTVPIGDVYAAEDALLRIYNGRFSASPHVFNREEIGKFERRELTGKLADLLNATT